MLSVASRMCKRDCVGDNRKGQEAVRDEEVLRVIHAKCVQDTVAAEYPQGVLVSGIG